MLQLPKSNKSLITFFEKQKKSRSINLKSYSIHNITSVHRPHMPSLSLSREENSFKEIRRNYKSPPSVASFQTNFKSDKKLMIKGFLRKPGQIRKNIKSHNALLDKKINLLKESSYSRKSEPKMTINSENLRSKKNQTILKTPLYEINRLKSRNTTFTELKSFTNNKYSFPLVTTGDETGDNESSFSSLILLNRSKRHSVNYQKSNYLLCFSPKHNSLVINTSQTPNILTENTNTNKIISVNQINGFDDPPNGYKKFVKQLSHIPEITQLMEEANSTRLINLKDNIRKPRLANKSIFEDEIERKVKHSITTRNCNTNNISIIKFTQENSVLSEKSRKAPSQSNCETFDNILGSLIHDSSYEKSYVKPSVKIERTNIKDNYKTIFNNSKNFNSNSNILLKLSIDISDELDNIDKEREKKQNILKDQVYNYINQEPNEINTKSKTLFNNKNKKPFDNKVKEMKLRFIVSYSLKLLNNKNKKSFFMIQKSMKTLILNTYFEIELDIQVLKNKYLDNVIEFEKRTSLLDNFSKKGCGGKKRSFQTSTTFSIPRKRVRMVTFKTKTMPKVIIMSADDCQFLNNFLKKDYFISNEPYLKYPKKPKKHDSAKSSKNLKIEKTSFQKQSTFKNMKKSKTKISGFNLAMKDKSNIF